MRQIKQGASAGRRSWWKTACAVCVLCAAAIAAPAQTFTTLVSFDKSNGGGPYAGLIQARDGSLYGTSYYGGTSGQCANPGCGVVYRVTPGGKLTTLYSFCSLGACADGGQPWAPLVQGTDGNFYGTTSTGGNNSQYGGTVFKITPNGTLTTLYSFCSESGCTDGGFPTGGLLLATDGNLYGTTDSGGARNGGTVFKITPSGSLTTLHDFCLQNGCIDGDQPWAGLAQSSDGSLYGTTLQGGSGTGDGGTVFKMSPNGTFTTLYSFCSQMNCTDGASAWGGVVAGTDGNLYGTTASGGTNNRGTVFKITPNGTLTTLYNFCSQTRCSDGAGSVAALIQATDGNFYGTTAQGGIGTSGTIFRITPDSTLTTLYRFCLQSGCADGLGPEAGLVQDTNGKFYGTAFDGGTTGWGTIFGLSVGLGPFVETLPTTSKVGRSVTILGNNLTGATSVTFNGTAATFTVEPPTAIKTTVPTGATTGPVQVTLPGGTLTSNVPFRVIP